MIWHIAGPVSKKFPYPSCSPFSKSLSTASLTHRSIAAALICTVYYRSHIHPCAPSVWLLYPLTLGTLTFFSWRLRFKEMKRLDHGHPAGTQIQVFWRLLWCSFHCTKVAYFLHMFRKKKTSNLGYDFLTPAIDN